MKQLARDEFWDALKEHAHRNHKERVSKNSDRIAYAIQQFEAHGIEYQLKNQQTGHFHCWRKSDDKLFQFYAGTGKIQGFTQVRGIHSLIQMLEGEPMAGEKNFENRLKDWLESEGIYPLGHPEDKMTVPPCGFYEKRWGGSRYVKSGLPDMRIT